MTCQDDSTKRAAIYMLSRGQATVAEVTKLTGRSRQIVRLWAKDVLFARDVYLTERWKQAQAAVRDNPAPNACALCPSTGYCHATGLCERTGTPMAEMPKLPKQRAKAQKG